MFSHVLPQNDLVESYIKCLQIRAVPLLMSRKLFIFVRDMLFYMHQHLYASGQQVIISSPLYDWVLVTEPNISHIRIFECAAYVLIVPPKRTKMGRLGIYVWHEFPSITKFFEPMIGDVFTRRFIDYHFDETIFSTLGGDTKQLEK